MKNVIDAITQTIRDSDSGHRNFYLLVFTGWLFARRWWAPFEIGYDSFVVLEAAALSGLVRALHRLYIRYSKAGRFAALRDKMEECRSNVLTGRVTEPGVKEDFNILNTKLKKLGINPIETTASRNALERRLQTLIVQASERESRRASKVVTRKEG